MDNNGTQDPTTNPGGAPVSDPTAGTPAPSAPGVGTDQPMTPPAAPVSEEPTTPPAGGMGEPSAPTGDQPGGGMPGSDPTSGTGPTTA